jgi:integrator complex subunit 12
MILDVNLIACSILGLPLPASKTASNSSKLAAVPTTSQKCIMPNINIISADKRLQIIKKKVAKMQEKRKHSK